MFLLLHSIACDKLHWVKLHLLFSTERESLSLLFSLFNATGIVPAECLSETAGEGSSVEV